MLLWPVLVVSAARAESASKVDLLLPRSVEPSALDRWISEVQKQYAKSLPYEAYQEIVSKLAWTDHERFDKRLAQLSCTISGYAKGPEGQDFAIAISVLNVGMHFTLTKLLGAAGSLPTQRSFRVPPRPEDEVWQFSSSQDSWEHLAGRAGLALVRERTVIDAQVTMMN